VQSLGESIEDGIELLSMGEHRLRGLPQALELFEVSAVRPPEALGRR